MRPTTGVMLQQNNNNNYPCLNVSGSTREMLQKCSRASLPFPSRLELGLGDLPLIRGLRAWALCSKNRCKAGGLLGGGQAPTAPPNSNRGSSTSCPRPADVYLSEEWGRMGYGLPLGMDARQAGIGALVTVATLKTSEGSGKTQTQCLFLRTEKGSCLYSTAKPGSAASTSTASSVVGGWLRGKTGGRDASTGRSLPAQTGANRVRVRSGRRWRKSGNAASREKTGMSRESHQRSREDPAGERQEVQDKRSLQQDGRRVRPEDDGVCRSPRCCHNVSTKTCDQCGKSVQRRESQDEGEGVPNRLNEDVKGMRKDGDGGLCESSNPDLQSSSSSDGDEIRGDDSSEEIKTQTDNFLDAEVLTDDFKSRHNNRKATEDHSEDVNGFSCVEVDEESEKEMERADVDDEKSVNQIPDESSAPVEGSVCSNDHNARWVETEQDHLEVNPRIMGKEEVDVSRFDLQESNCAANEENTVKPQLFSENEVTEEKEDASSPLRCRDSSTSETHVKNVTENSCDGRTDVVELEEEEEEFTCIELDGGDDDDKQRHQINSCKDEDDEDACSNTSVRETGANASNVGSADPSTLLQISPANPDPSLPPLGSMATGPPCLKEEEEEEEEEEGRLGATAREEEKKRHGRELEEEEEEEERGSTVDTAARREEEEEEEEDEFGVFMQAEGEPAWSMSASVPCGSRESVAVAVTEESTSWTSGWTDASDDSWTAFPQDSSDEGGQDVTGQWWPTSAVEDRTRRLTANQSLASVFAEAFPFPSPPAASPDPDGVPTLTQLLGSRVDQNQGLLDSFHDLNKMIVQRYKRASGVSRDLLLKTLHLQPPQQQQQQQQQTESRPAPWTAHRRLSPGLPSANQHAQNAAAKRRLSYDYNRNVTE